MLSHFYRRRVFFKTDCKIKYKTKYILFLLLIAASPLSFSEELIRPYIESSQNLEVFMGLDQGSYYNSGVNMSGLSFGLETSPLNEKYYLKAFGLLQMEEGLRQETVFTWSVPEAYVSVGKTAGLSWFVGRKLFEATDHADLELNGFWNNSWDFRKDQITREGLLGVFLEKEKGNTRFQLFASALSAPKLTQHYEFDDRGAVEATTPWFTLPPEQINYRNTNYDVNYFLEDFDYLELASEAQVGGNLRTKINSSLDMNLSYLYAPSKDVDLGLSFLIDAASDNTPIELTVRPEQAYFHKVGTEITKTWSSKSRTTLALSAQFRQNNLQTSSDMSWVGMGDGVYAFLAHELELKKMQAKLFVATNSLQMESVGELDEVLESSLQINYRYDIGGGFSLQRRLNKLFSLNLFGYVDLENQGALGRVFLTAQSKKLRSEVGVSFVEAFGTQTTGFYRSFRENDLFYTRINYVF